MNQVLKSEPSRLTVWSDGLVRLGKWAQCPALGLPAQTGAQTLHEIHSPVLFHDFSVPCFHAQKCNESKFP